MSNKTSSNTAFKMVEEYINLGHDYRKSLAFEALNLIQEKLKDSKKKYDELFRMTESYIKHLHAAEAENKRLKEALHKIADCGCPLVENEYGYTSELPECRRIAESVL